MKTRELKVDEIVVKNRIRQAYNNIESLAESIKEFGLIQPLAIREVDGQSVLLAGGRRLKALQMLGWEKAPVHICENLEDEQKALQAEQVENTCREDLLPGEIVAFLSGPEGQEEKAKAKSRQKTGTGVGSGKKSPSVAATEGNQESTEAIAILVGKSPNEVKNINTVMKAAEEGWEVAQEAINRWNLGDIDPTPHVAAKAVRDAKREGEKVSRDRIKEIYMDHPDITPEKVAEVTGASVEHCEGIRRVLSNVLGPYYPPAKGFMNLISPKNRKDSYSFADLKELVRDCKWILDLHGKNIREEEDFSYSDFETVALEMNVAKVLLVSMGANKFPERMSEIEEIFNPARKGE